MATAKLRGQAEILIDAPAERVWEILENPTAIPSYMPMVEGVEVPTGQREEAGAIRTCQVNFQGRRGQVVERCVEATPGKRLTHETVSDTIGFERMFSEFRFSFVLEEREPDATLVRLEGYYRERGPIARLMEALVLRRKFDTLRRQVLANLKERAEAAAVGGEVAAASKPARAS